MMSGSWEASLHLKSTEDIHSETAALQESVMTVESGKATMSLLSSPQEACHLGWDGDVMLAKAKHRIAWLKHEVNKRGLESGGAKISNNEDNGAHRMMLGPYHLADPSQGVSTLPPKRHHLVVSVEDLEDNKDNNKNDNNNRESASGWKINMYLDDSVVGENLLLRDPFTETEESELHWYLEEFPTVSPYAAGRAKRAKENINRYISSLHEQLGLGKIVQRIRPRSEHQDATLQISIIESQETISPPGNTAHSLHWECLESRHAWGFPELTVTVQRSVGFSDLPKRRDFDGLIRNRVPRYNILLVLARDSSSQSTVQDLEPFRTLRTFLQIRDRLWRSKAPMKMEISVARPGTFKRFKRCLEERTERHGPGYFRAVHFDMHGSVSPEFGEAYLHFCKEGRPGKLAKRRAKDVASLLRHHHVDFAFLNCCETAKATRGNAANLAETFMLGGIPFTLAMSFKVLGSTATDFASTFYESLLIRGKEALGAVTDARQRLQDKHIRYARFDREISLMDWVVPVVYSYGTHIPLAPPCGEETLSVTPGQKYGYPGMDHIDDLLLGRDSDCLHLEHELIENPTLAVAGRPGVGSTTLVRHLAEIWVHTEFIQHMLYLPFSMFTPPTMDTIMRHLLSSSLSRDCCEFENTPGMKQFNTANLDSKDLDSRALALIERHSVVLVFDELVDAFAINRLLIHRAGLDENDQGRLLKFFERLSKMNLDRANSRYPSYTILIGHGFERWWNKRFKTIPRMGFYELNGLKLEHALQLCAKLIEAPSEALETRNALDSLEQCCLLLEGNPQAIATVIRKLQSKNISIENFFYRLHTHTAGITLDSWDVNLHRCHILEDLMWNAASENRRSSPRLMCLYFCLGLFWRRGPNLKAYAESIGLNHSADWGEIYLRTSAIIGADRGFFEITGDWNISWLHPLASIFWRQMLFAWLTMNNNAVPPLLTLKTIFAKHLDDFVLARELKSLKALDVVNLRREARLELYNAITLAEMGLQMDADEKLYTSAFRVLLEYLDLCTLYLSDAEFSTMARYSWTYATALDVSYGENTPGFDKLQARLCSLSRLDELYRSDYISRRPQNMKFGSAAIGICETYEQSHGTIRDPNTKLLKANAFSAAANEAEDAAEAMRLATTQEALEAEVYDLEHPDNKTFLTQTSDFNEALSVVMSALGMVDLPCPKQSIIGPRIPAQNPYKVHEYAVGRPLMKEIAKIISEKGLDDQGRTPYEAIPPNLLQRLEEYHKFMGTYAEANKIEGLDALVPDFEEKPILNHLTRYRDPKNRLLDLEEAQGNQDWAVAAFHLMMLAERARCYKEFDDAIAYQERVMELCESHPDQITPAFVAKAKAYHKELAEFVEFHRLQHLANMAVAKGEFVQFNQYSTTLDTMTRNLNADQVQKDHFELMAGFSQLLCLIAQDKKGVSVEDVAMVDQLSGDSTPLKIAPKPTTGVNDDAQEKQTVNEWQPNRATTADPIQYLNLMEYNSCLKRSLQALKLQLEGSFDRALAIYHEIAVFAKEKPHLEAHVELLKFFSEKCASQGDNPPQAAQQVSGHVGEAREERPKSKK